MRVSVLIPSHNGAWCIARTLRSVQSQTLTDFEAIIVDDGSTDETAEVVRNCIADDPRFQLVRQPNAGVAAARNRALAMAKGDYAAPIDHDDLWDPDFLARTMDALDRSRGRGVMAFTRSILIDASDHAPTQTPPDIPPHVDYRELLRRNPIGNGSCMVARRDALQRIGFDRDLVARFGQADDWWTQLQLSWSGEIIFIDAPLVRYRITADGASSTQIRRITRATLEVIRRAKRKGPPLARRDYLDARSLALVWQARRAKAAGQRWLALELGALAYLSHPAWLLEPDLREALLGALANRLLGRKRPDLWSSLVGHSRP